MDDLWHLKACQGPNRNYSQSSPVSTSVNQIETLSGPFGHPFVQHEVCVIERTIRQDTVGANLRNCGLQGPNMKSIRGDVGNSLLALVPGCKHQVRSSYQSVVTTQSPLLSSNPQAYQMASVSSPFVDSWPGHFLNMAAGNRFSGNSSGLAGDSSVSMPGQEVTLSMLGREVNLTQFSRMTAEQDCLESSPTMTSEVEMSKHNDNANDISGQGPYRQWLTEIISSRETGQNTHSPTFASGTSSPSVSESSRDGCSVMSSLTTYAPSLMQEAHVACVNYDTGQIIVRRSGHIVSGISSRFGNTGSAGGKLYLTQSGFLGVICSCHGSHMSVAKFTQIKVPYDNQGWNWSEEVGLESGPTKCKAVVAKGWEKEVDVSYSGEPLVRSRPTQVWDVSVSPRSAVNYPLNQNSGCLGLSSNLGDVCVLNSKESSLESFERVFRSSSVEFGSSPSTAEDVRENVGRCRVSPDMHSSRNSSTEFINFISGSEQLVAGHTEHQLAAEQQVAVGRRSLLKGLDLTWTDRRESLQHGKNSLSSFELKLGQPSQQSRPTGHPVAGALNQAQRVLQRGGQQNIQNTSATTAGGLHTLSGFEEPSNICLVNHPTFADTTYMEPNHHRSCWVDPNRGMEGNGSVLVNLTSCKQAEVLSMLENLREIENRHNRNADQSSTGMRTSPSSVGCVGSSFKLLDGLGMSTEPPTKRWVDVAQLQMGGAARPSTQGHQDLDTVLSQEWMSMSRPSENHTTESSGTMAVRGGQVGCGESMVHIQRDCTPAYRGNMNNWLYVRRMWEGYSIGTTIPDENERVGGDEDVCMKDVNQEGIHAEADRQKVHIVSSQRPSTQDCSSPRGCQLRYFQAVTTQACECGAKLVGEHSNQGYKANSLARNAHAPTSVSEADIGFDKMSLIQEGLVVKAGSRESNHDIFRFKEMGRHVVPGNDTIPEATQDDVSSLRSLAEDLLVDMVANVNLGVAVSSKISDEQQAPSESCSKSSKNVTSGFSDAFAAEGEVSDAHSVEKISMTRRVVGEAFRIGKFSLSAGGDLGLMPSWNILSKGNHTSKQGPSSSQGYSSLCNGMEGSRTKVRSRSRGDYAVEGLAARHMAEGILDDTRKVVKRKRTLNEKCLDATTGTAHVRRQKLSPSVNVAEKNDPSQKHMKWSDLSNFLGHKNMVGFSRSLCGKDSATKAHKMMVTQGNHAAVNEEHGMELNDMNCTDSRQTDDRYLTTTDTLVLRVPQSLVGKKAKCSGRSKTGKRKMVVAAQDDMTCNKSALSEMITVDPSPVDNSIITEPTGTGGCIPELIVSAAKSLPKHCSTLNMQSGKTGRVVLRRPSPRNATRMVSLNEIMNRPEVVGFTAPKDHIKAPVNDVLLHQDDCMASGCKGHPNACSFKNGMKACALKGGLESFSCKDSLQMSTLTEGLKCLPTIGGKVSNPKEVLKMSATEGSKVRLCSWKDDLKVCSSKGGLRTYPAKDGLKVTLAKQGPTILKNGWTAFSGKGGSKKWISDVNLTTFCPKRGLKVSGPAASPGKENLKESVPKSVVTIPVTMDSCEVAALRACSKAAATKNRPSTRISKSDTHLPVEDCLKLSCHQDVWEALGPRTGFKTATVRDTLEKLASRDAFQNSVSLDIGMGSVPKDVSNPSVLKDGSKSFVPMDSLESSSNSKTEGKAWRKPDSSLDAAVVAHDDHDNSSPQVGNSWKESKNITRSHRQEVQKIRSLYELISEKNMSGTRTGVFEFHDEDVKPSGIIKQDSVYGPILQLHSTFSIPVHFTDSKCLVPGGERSQRGKPAKTKNLFLQRHKSGSRGGGKLQAEPVEIVVGRNLVEERKLNAGSPMTTEKEILTDAKLCPVTPRKWSPLKNKTKCEVIYGTPSSAQLASSLIQVKELLGKGMSDYSSKQSHKRASKADVIGNDFKRQKFLESSRTSQLRSGLLKARHPLPTSRPTKPTMLSIDVVGPRMKENKMKPLAIENGLNIPGRKERCQRQKCFDCHVPGGLVECCVCGSSISEFFNQIVCCSRCPVKVHQACYGVKKIPNSTWCCRTCKATATDPICVLCGYGGGAMTRAKKAIEFLKGLVKVWQQKINPKEKADIGSPHSIEFLEIGMLLDHSLTDHQHLLETPEISSCSVRGKATRELSEFDSSYLGCRQRFGNLVPRGKLMTCNTVASGLLDSTELQWVHMVCALWMPGTRCLNFGTMGVFDVSGVSQSRRKLVCSICNRKGGACVQCRIVKCGIPFHAWCAHKKGLLQSEIVGDGSDQVGFYGTCLRHGKRGDLWNDNSNLNDMVTEEIGPQNATSSTCARTEGYAGKLTLEQRALLRRQATRNGPAAVSPEQVAAWLKINERKTCKARRFLKSANSDQKTDHREYLRYKQEQGWRRLSVYKSGIHALGLYTAEFIGRGEMVVEYIGEIVGLRVADKREADYHSGKRMQYQGACYLFRIDRERIIDATRKGGIARFVNHSCSPNCVAKVICVKNQSKVVFFAQRDIYAGEEITYDYQFNFEQEGDKIPCFCGSANCRGTLN